MQVTLFPAGGVATVNFTSDPILVVGPDQTLAIAQVVYTVTQQPGVTGVTFEIAGKAIEVPTAAGAQVPGPVARADYAPQAPLPDSPAPPAPAGPGSGRMPSIRRPRAHSTRGASFHRCSRS